VALKVCVVSLFSPGVVAFPLSNVTLWLSRVLLLPVDVAWVFVTKPGFVLWRPGFVLSRPDVIARCCNSLAFFSEVSSKFSNYSMYNTATCPTRVLVGSSWVSPKRIDGGGGGSTSAAARQS